MGLRLPLRRSTSFTPDHPALMEVPGPTALKMEANVLVMGADNVGKSGENDRELEQGVPRLKAAAVFGGKEGSSPWTKLVRWG